MTRLALAGCAGLLATACASGGTLDVVPSEPSGPTSGPAATAAAQGGSYARVAKRPMGFVALTSAVGVDPDEAARVVDHLADAMDACATDLAQHGKLVDGAIRVTAQVKDDGAVVASHVTVAPGDAVAANALLCVVAPLKMTTLSPAPASGNARSFAIDASWGPATK